MSVVAREILHMDEEEEFEEDEADENEADEYVELPPPKGVPVEALVPHAAALRRQSSKKTFVSPDVLYSAIVKVSVLLSFYKKCGYRISDFPLFIFQLSRHTNERAI